MPSVCAPEVARRRGAFASKQIIHLFACRFVKSHYLCACKTLMSLLRHTSGLLFFRVTPFLPRRYYIFSNPPSRSAFFSQSVFFFGTQNPQNSQNRLHRKKARSLSAAPPTRESVGCDDCRIGTKECCLQLTHIPDGSEGEATRKVCVSLCSLCET